MEKKYFLLLWSLFLFTGYFLYFSPLSVYHLNKKWELVKELKEKNLSLETYNLSFVKDNFELEKKDYFLDMGYSEKKQVIVDIQLPPITQLPNTEKPPIEMNFSKNNWLSLTIFFFCLSLFIIIFFVFYYHRSSSKN